MDPDSFISYLMGRGLMDAAILSSSPGAERVLASHPEGQFANITTAEIRALVTRDRRTLHTTGITLAGDKCIVLRDFDCGAPVPTMDLRTKGTDQDCNEYNICVGKNREDLVLVRGQQDTHGGMLNQELYSVLGSFRDLGCFFTS